VKAPLRIVAPVLLAIVCAGLFVALLWWQLSESTGILRNANIPFISEGDDLNSPIPQNDEVDPRNRALSSLREGDLYALRGEWKQALNSYEESVDEGGGLPALRKLAQAQLQLRDIDGVQDTIKQLRRQGARAEDLLLLEVIINLRTGELVKARSMLDSATDSPQKEYGLVLLSIIEGNHDLAQEHIQKVLNGWEPVLRSYARTMQAAYDEYALFPESPNIHLVTLIARSLAQVQECELALPLLSQVTQSEDDYRDAWIVQGYCELTTNRPEQALASLERSYSLDPLKPEIQYFLARAYADLNDPQNAITFLEYSLTNGFEPEEEIRRLIAREALLKGDADLALAQYDALTKKEDATVEAYEGYVEASLTLERNEEAYIKASEAIVKFPNDATAHELLGRAAYATDRKDEAKSELEEALAIDPYLTIAKDLLRKL